MGIKIPKGRQMVLTQQVDRKRLIVGNIQSCNKVKIALILIRIGHINKGPSLKPSRTILLSYLQLRFS